MTLQDLKDVWRNSDYVNKGIHEAFVQKTNSTPELKAHRDWVEQNIFGFGERSFHWLHQIVVNEMPETFKFLEIGGFRMQVVSLYQILADKAGKKVDRYCVSPMSGMDGHWESDYFADSKRIHDQFNIPNDYKLFHGSSTDSAIIAETSASAPYDVVYIDGGHTYEVVKSDLENYVKLVKPGGYLIIDDCSNNLQMWPGCFPGIASVSRAVDEFMPAQTDFEHIGAVMHNRIWKRK